MRQRDQELAGKAWKAVRDLAGEPLREEFRTRVMALPAMLQSAGLIATLAFLAAKRNSADGELAGAYRKLFGILTEHITGNTIQAGQAGARPSEVLAWLSRCSPLEYRRAAAQARDLAVWLRRAAEAELPRAAAGQQAPGEGPHA